MGYKPQPKRYIMEFVEHPGLEVVCTSTSLGQLLEIAKMKVKLNEEDETKQLAIFVFFSERIASWNVEHPDIPGGAEVCPRCELAPGADLPTTVDGLLCLDLDFIMPIIFGWIEAISRVAAPKGMSSNDGATNTREEWMSQLGQLASPLTSPMLS